MSHSTTPHGASAVPRPGAPPVHLDDVARAAAHAFDLLPGGPGRHQESGLAQRVRTDPETVERDLARLVLTLVELLRQLMERAALHRVEQGDLAEDQEERIGLTLMTLQDRMAELCARHGLDPEELNLDLGPLGSLLPRS